MNKLPSDIQSLIRKRIAKKLLIFFVLEAVSIFLFLYVAANSSLSENLLTYFVVLLFLVVYPIFAVKLHLIIKDRAYTGAVISIKIIDEMGTYKSLKNIIYYPKQSIILTVKLKNGKTKDIKVKSVGQASHHNHEVPSEGKIEDHISNYSIGDTLYHFPTLEHPLIIPKEPADFSLCVVCGTKNSIERCECLNCYHTLIHP